ncbi:excinuclease ABC subunit UvrC [Actinobacillus equuli]|uniref:excinuclease ABC subunit UvrC n=1 Tax=Actinobacillus equuli TaxID=718 RepID=UPI0024427C8E|nr:excinuclease ABC subunit UvrC [Actinobacillus equuli]WGE46867.1 excinuclease ABC subunit UvrC [Actinobacillus equuli subsp. haemolyticus]WGE51071.1 excinuclease ABC subunit UvrC [Actinobacillus equuli subsp. haemolyticus]WGE53237.1 excinuclease ABC subunit UvrC [Actinobacillus equuli subsp. haemolyticus]WGE73671.1 excinuclease ABC subunit UvrC [Actinobacillus equuli subsp. haemolyticus]WGE85877.1 excinuclease ABC subunit UvrC [Actinobacillus equuli subsp. haemolyticus]
MFDAKSFLADVPHLPGVYRMYDAKNTIIYVGKAKDLKKRLSSYFRSQLASKKTEALVANIHHIETTITHSETEALLLEHNYIKENQPKYNVLLRDDKSYPYILLTKHQHPRITSFRGSKKIAGEYFGPYPNAGAVRETLNLLQKLFPIRQCEDSYYKNRSRPCLQYQIGRCLAPCVEGYYSQAEYDNQVNLVRLFLQGKDGQVIEHLVQKMESAAQELDFEAAARFRDQIQSVRAVQEKQFVSNERLDDLDIISIAYQHGIACVHILFVRHGKVLGNRSYFPKVPNNTDLTELADTFVGQFYLQMNQHRTIPNQIIIDQPLSEAAALANVLSEQAGHKVSIVDKNIRGDKSRYLALAKTNAEAALTLQLKQDTHIRQRYDSLKALLNLAEIKRMECFDISHTMGNQTVASCVVFDENGPLKSDYRRFNIEGITGGDDYAAMEQALLKRYDRNLEEEKIPDIIFIDGGKGQLNRALETFASLNVSWDKRKPLLIGVAKGVERKAGLETLLISKWDKEIHLPPDSPALHLIQHIRDESHNHAITGHRKKRQKAFTESGLESIAGVGAKRRQALLKYLGGMQGVKSATLEEIQSVPGISKQLAEVIFDTLQNS